VKRLHNHLGRVLLRPVLGTLLITLVSCLAAPSLLAHDFSTSWSVFRVDGPRVEVDLTLALADLHSGPNFDTDLDGRVTRSDVARQETRLFQTITDHFGVTAPDPPDTLEMASYTVEGDSGLTTVRLRYVFDHEVSEVSVVSSLDQITQPDHRHLLQIGPEDEARFTVLTADAPNITIDHAAGIPLWATVFEFIHLGVEHIFTGYDHLAFLIGLLLATTTLLSLVQVVTFFTLAHSATLVLATLGIVALPPRLIESLIALSIAWVAVENFTGKMLVHRRVVTFVFGLVHGFGFSNVLRDMGLARSQLAVSLASFNVGVEIGQLLFVALLFPLLMFVFRQKWKEHAVAAASVSIMCLGFYWFVQRAFVS
jgi:HupE / UreJ protein